MLIDEATYEATCKRVVAAVEAWRAANAQAKGSALLFLSSHDEGNLVIGSLSGQLERRALNDTARHLCGYVCACEPNATWLQFVVAVRSVYHSELSAAADHS